MYSPKIIENIEAVLSRTKPIPFRDELREEQRKYFHLVTQHNQWRKVDALFRREVEEFGVISSDTESRIHFPEEKVEFEEEWHAFVYLIIGTGNGHVFVLHLQRLREMNPKQPFREIIPAAVVKAIEDEKIIKIGSGMLIDAIKDYKANGINIKTVADTTRIHCDWSLRTERLEENPTGRHGLGRVSYDLFGYDFKPQTRKKRKIFSWDTSETINRQTYRQMAEDLFIERYGPHGYAVFPPYRSPLVQYRWKLPMRSFDENYLFLDAMVPVCLVFTVVVEDLKKTATEKTNNQCENIRSLLWRVLQEYTEQTDNLTIPTPKKKKFHISEQPPITVIQGGEPGFTNHKGLFRSDLDWWEKEIGEGAIQDAYIRNVSDKRNRRKRGLGACFMLPSKLNGDNILDISCFRRCSFCGGKTHSKRKQDMSPMCQKFIERLGQISQKLDLTPLCSYPLCKETGYHYTSMCPLLHDICSLCQKIGHRSHHCLSYSQVYLTTLFNENADLGIFTRLSHDPSNWSIAEGLGQHENVGDSDVEKVGEKRQKIVKEN